MSTVNIHGEIVPSRTRTLHIFATFPERFALTIVDQPRQPIRLRHRAATPSVDTFASQGLLLHGRLLSIHMIRCDHRSVTHQCHRAYTNTLTLRRLIRSKRGQRIRCSLLASALYRLLAVSSCVKSEKMPRPTRRPDVASSTVTGSAHRTQWPSQAEWEHYKQHIVGFYINKEMRLSSVMQCMKEQYKFEATYAS